MKQLFIAIMLVLSMATPAFAHVHGDYRHNRRHDHHRRHRVEPRHRVQYYFNYRYQIGHLEIYSYVYFSNYDLRRIGKQYRYAVSIFDDIAHGYGTECHCGRFPRNIKLYVYGHQPEFRYDYRSKVIHLYHGSVFNDFPRQLGYWLADECGLSRKLHRRLSFSVERKVRQHMKRH